MTNGRQWGVALVIAATLLAPVARGQTPVAPDRATQTQASRLFDEALLAYDRGELRAAIEKLEAAFQLMPTAPVLFNLGQFQETAGERARAFDSFEKYLAIAGDSISRERREAVESKLAQLRAQVAKLEVTTDPPSASLFLNGVNVGKLPTLEPGRHELRAELAGFETVSLDVTAEPGSSLRIVCRLRPVASPPATTRSAADGPVKSGRPGTGALVPKTKRVGPNASRVWGALLGTGASLAAGAGIAYAFAQHESSVWQREREELARVPANERDEAFWDRQGENVERSRRIRHLDGVQLGLLLGAAAVSVAGVSLWLTGSLKDGTSGLSYAAKW